MIKHRENFAFIDAIRGVAALLVLAYHLDIHVVCGYPDKPIPPHSWSWLLFAGTYDMGKFAVGLFFLVSGFLIPSTLRGPHASVRRFAVHRFFRLYPAYWLAIAVATLLPLTYEAFHPRPVPLLVNLTMLQHFVGVEDWIGVFWTLQIELIFYVICAVLFACGLLERRLLMVAGMLALALATAVARARLHRQLPVALFVALTLMFLGDMLRSVGRPEVGRRPVVAALALVWLGLVPTCLIGYEGEGPKYLATYWLAIAVFLIAWALHDRFQSRGVAGRMIVFFGSISYGVYLLQTPLGLVPAGRLHGLHGWTSPLALAAVAYAATIPAAWLSYRLVEAPCIAIGRRIGRRWEIPANDLAASVV